MKKSERLVAIISGSLIFLSSFFFKFNVSGEPLTIWGNVFKPFLDGSFPEYWTKDYGIGGYPLFASFVIMGFAMLLYLISVIAAFRWKHNNAVDFLKRTLPYFFLFTVQFNYYFLWIYGILALEFIISKYLSYDVPEEALAKSQALAEREKKLAFPGKYPKMLHQLIRDTISYNWKESLILGFGCLISALSLAFLIGNFYSNISRQTSYETITETNSLVGTLAESGGLLIVLLLMLLYVVFSNHIPVIKQKTEIFLLLGARRKLFYRLCIEDYIYGILGGGLLGFLMGAVFLAVRGRFDLTGLLIAFVIYLLIAFTALLLNFEKIRWLLYIWNPEPRKEYVQNHRWDKWLILLGLLFLGFGYHLFATPKYGEFLPLLFVGLIGMYLLLRGSMSSFLVWQHLRKDYLKHLLARNTFYHDFLFNFNALFILSCLALSIFGFFSVNMVSKTLIPDETQRFPYDVMALIYDQDLTKIKEIKEKYHVKEERYPMIRMSAVDGDKTLDPWGGGRPVMLIQGQHIGISETTYLKLKQQLGMKAEALQLKADQIHIVHQQDPSIKTQPIDWDLGSKLPRLRYGQPLLSYNTANVDLIFPEHPVKGEEKTILTGEPLLGTQESLVVLADETFHQQHQAITEKNKKNWSDYQTIDREDWRVYPAMHDENLTDGPTNLVLWQAEDPGDIAKIGEALAFLKEKYPLEREWDTAVKPYYTKAEYGEKTRLQETLDTTMVQLMLLILYVLTFFFFFARFILQSKKIFADQRFLNDIGMRPKERGQILTNQLLVYTLLPNIIGFILGLGYLWIVLRNRFYNAADVAAFAKYYSIFFILHCMAWIAAFFILRRILYRKVDIGGKHK